MTCYRVVRHGVAASLRTWPHRPSASSNCLSAGIPVGITPVVSQLRLGGLTNVVLSQEARVVEGHSAPSTKIGMELIPY